MSQVAAPRWIRFHPIPMKVDAKTQAWDVRTRDGVGYLGQIRWASRWRCYAFFTIDNTYFEPQCLRDLANFIELQTGLQREVARQRRTAAAELTEVCQP